MEKEMAKEKNIMIMAIWNLKENIYLEKEMVKEKNIMIMAIWNLKENI